MKKIISIILLTVFISSCGKTDEIVKEEGKKDFFVMTKKGSEFSSGAILEKVGKISSSQDITLNSNANGRISSINVKPGDSVYAGQVIARLEDNIGNYGISLERAGIGIERAKINYDSTELSLEKNIFDAELNLEKLKRNLEVLKKDSKQSIIVATDTLDNSDFSGLDSKSALQIQQLDNNIEKAKLDYDIKLVADDQQIDSYSSTLRKDFNTLQTSLDDAIEFSDKILGVTDINRTENDRYEMFLGAEDTSQKRVSETKLRELINYRDSGTFSGTKSVLTGDNVSQEELLDVIEFIDGGYEQLQEMLNNLEETLFNTTPSVGEISQQQIDGFLATINGYQSVVQGNAGAFISVSTSMKTFLKTYKNNQASIQKGIELQKKDREIQLKNFQSSEINAQTGLEKTLLTTQDRINDLEDQIKTAQNNLNNAKSNLDINLRSLKNSISDARVSYSTAAKDYGKLTITAPINGTIGDVFVDVGQEVFSGNKLFDIVSDNTPEVEVSFSKKERNLVRQGQVVFVNTADERLSGTIYSISDVADDNLNYKSTIVFQSGASLIGNLVTLEIPLETNSMLIPLNIIKTQGDEIGLVKILSGSTFADVRVRMGDVYGSLVEVVSCAKQCEDLQVITSDISNYDSNKFTIIQK